MVIKKRGNKTRKTKKMTSNPLAKGLFFLSIGVLIIFLFTLWRNLAVDIPVSGQTRSFQIEKGDTYSGLINRLAAKGDIPSPVIAKIYQRLFIHQSLKAGVYEIDKGTSIRQFLSMLSDSNHAKMNRLQVIEGTTFKQLKQKLQDDPDIKKTIINGSDQSIIKALNLPYDHLEGMFAPNTYFFPKEETDLNILQTLSDIQIKRLNESWQNRQSNLPYKSAYDALIMASIIEKETNLDKERAKVAGVFVRRLRIGMRLQTDPTVIYGMGDRYDGDIRRKDLRTPTPYNTYTINGLPPTPISLPSSRSIEAALHPEESRAIYFVATGKGGHQFSATLAEHNKAVQDYLAVLKQQKMAGE